MPYEFGDVVLVPFPFTNQAATKQRPAVIVSRRAYAAEPIMPANPDVIVMAVTSQSHPADSLGGSELLSQKIQFALRAAINAVLG